MDFFGGGNGSDEKARSLMNKSIKEWDTLDIPELEDLDPELLQYLGDLQLQGVNPGQGVSYEGVDTAFDQLSADPVLREKQLASMGALDEIIQGGGLNLTDRANLNRIQNDTAQADRGRRDAIRQSMSARGMGGSGLDLLAQLDSSQAATDRQSQAGMDVAGMAQQRALDAIMQSGSLAGNVRNQDFGEQSTVANAKDAITKFNSANQLQTNQFNKGNELDAGKFNASTQNQAATANWQGKQNTANANVGIRSEADRYNQTQKPLTQFDMQAKKVGGKTGAYAGGQQYYQSEGDRKAASDAAMMGGAATIGAAAIAASDERVKKDIGPLNADEIRDFLTAVQPKKYKYKDGDTPTTKPGERMGFMLQDVQDTKIGRDLTQKMPDGTLAYDKDNLDGVMLAALSDLMKERENN